ncbi:UNVERIFIED_CONTAM: hypothetical protein Cloal_1107 [Acetivibrio alkalicellulosi]
MISIFKNNMYAIIIHVLITLILLPIMPFIILLLERSYSYVLSIGVFLIYTGAVISLYILAGAFILKSQNNWWNNLLSVCIVSIITCAIIVFASTFQNLNTVGWMSSGGLIYLVNLPLFPLNAFLSNVIFEPVSEGRIYIITSFIPSICFWIGMIIKNK